MACGVHGESGGSNDGAMVIRSAEDKLFQVLVL